MNVIDFQLIPVTQDLQTSLLRLLFKPNQKKSLSHIHLESLLCDYVHWTQGRGCHSLGVKLDFTKVNLIGNEMPKYGMSGFTGFPRADEGSQSYRLDEEFRFETYRIRVKS